MAVVLVPVCTAGLKSPMVNELLTSPFFSNSVAAVITSSVIQRQVSVIRFNTNLGLYKRLLALLVVVFIVVECCRFRNFISSEGCVQMSMQGYWNPRHPSLSVMK